MRVKNIRSCRLLISAIFIVQMPLGSSFLQGQDKNAESSAFFENHVRPLLVERCLKCHGPSKSESGLRLDQFSLMMKGGDSGSALVAGDTKGSLLLKAIRHEDGLEMPPKEKLNQQQISSLEEWVLSGAFWPEGEKLGSVGAPVRSGPISDEERAFWSLQPIADPNPPDVESPNAINNDIDRFVLSRLSEDKLGMRRQTDKRTLLRRATFDLTGLPPTREEIEAFLTDETPAAYSKVIERLLASAAYGERWGRHWLDVVRYADTAGETADYPTPLSYKYRNWVIDAFNSDMPYDEFIREQIAGDILGAEMIVQAGSSPSQDTLNRYREMMTATGFIAISRRFGFDVENYHYLTIQDTIDTVGQSVLGLTLGCARCHDHKFDPVNMTDYYAWYGIFDSTKYSFPGSEEKKRPYDSFPAIPPQVASQRTLHFEQQVAALDGSLKQLESEKAAIEMQAASVLGTTGFCGFENETIGEMPSTPWSGLDSAKISESSQSPFTNAFPIGSRGISCPSDEANNAFGRTLATAHTAENTPILYYNIDFRNLEIAASGTGSYRFYMGHGPGNSGAVEVAANATHLLLKNGGGYEPICELKMGTWYNLQITADLKTKTYSGRIASASSEAVGFSGRAFTSGWDGIIDYTFVDKYGPGSGATPAHDIDNLLIDTNSLLPFDKSIADAAALAERLKELSETINRLASLRKQIESDTVKLDSLKKSGPIAMSEMVYGAMDKEKPSDTPIQLRGDILRLGDVVPRRNLEVLGGENLTGPGSGRRELAQWLTRPTNPLTARVMVNRIWQQHFGRGIVSTENDFGARGQRPSHPELLDWLASRFIESGWSIKSMHRMIMESASYQQSGDYDDRAAELDPDAKLLWRFNRRRLSAEEIRDAILMISNNLDPTMPGEHPFPPVDTWGYTQHSPYYAVYPTNHRSLYLMQQRLKRHPYLSLFDGPDTNVSTSRREPTTVPTQSLFLMNNELVHESSIAIAKNFLAAMPDTREQIYQLFMLTLGRPATKAEIDEALDFQRDYETALAASSGMPGDAPNRTLFALAAFVRSLLTRNEFLFVD